jgi:aldehyde dehydrogenase (NAD+)
MPHYHQFYIDGAWVDPAAGAATPRFTVSNPATEAPLCELALGSAADIDRAVAAARRAFETFSLWSLEERAALLERIIEGYKARMKEIAAAISDEMGAPLGFAEKAQAAAGLGHIVTTLKVMREYAWEEPMGKALLVKEPSGVAGLITPWNWPMNQITCKVAPALAAGCTMVLKPSEFTPTCALIFAEILHEAGVPAGVFNLVNGLGPEVGAALSSHPDVDMMSFTGSTRAGIDVAQRASITVKRVSQELGGKSPNLILEDADLEKAVTASVLAMMGNCGQSCNAPSRLFVPAARMDEAAGYAAAAVARMKVGLPRDPETRMGPVVSSIQWHKIQKLIEAGVAEGAKLAAGGPGRPVGLEQGWFIQPTIFTHATNDMTIAREEIFGPVLTIIGYATEDDAIRMANDTPYGLAGYVHSGDLDHARRVARRLRTGNVNLNGAPNEIGSPFGGRKQSGNGREWGQWGLEDFLEIKAIAGYTPAA